MNLKEMVGYEAVKLVEDGDVVGLGTGSTTQYFIKKLGERIKEEELEVIGIPTSYQSFFLASASGISLTTLNEHDINIAVDGADEVDPSFNLIKGGGAAHTMEKIVDGSAARFVVIVDSSKMVSQLGGMPVPVEVLPESLRVVQRKIETMDGSPTLRIAEHKDGPVITDNGNFIVDVTFEEIGNPYNLEVELNSIPGVIENGIFAGLAHEVLVGTDNEVKTIKRL